jgi:hypothetical protein
MAAAAYRRGRIRRGRGASGPQTARRTRLLTGDNGRRLDDRVGHSGLHSALGEIISGIGGRRFRHVVGAQLLATLALIAMAITIVGLPFAAVFWLIGTVIGPVLGFALIFANISLLLINLIGALVFALLVPYIAIGRTLLYFDLEAEQAGAPARKRWRERLPGRGAAPAEASAPAR